MATVAAAYRLADPIWANRPSIHPKFADLTLVRMETQDEDTSCNLHSSLADVVDRPLGRTSRLHIASFLRIARLCSDGHCSVPYLSH